MDSWRRSPCDFPDFREGRSGFDGGFLVKISTCVPTADGLSASLSKAKASLSATWAAAPGSASLPRLAGEITFSFSQRKLSANIRGVG
jgi:hypothetical protein